LKECFPGYFADPNTDKSKQIEIVDVGCGYGGLIVNLSPIFPDLLMIGLEIRLKVSEYVRNRILSLRKDNPGKYNNISVLRTNAMKFCPNIFRKGQLTKMFFCFPDPHFKKSNYRRRIINPTLLSEYAYYLTIGGKLYTITDVEDLFNWNVEHLKEHPLFEPVSEDEVNADPCVNVMRQDTEEGKKVERNQGKKWWAVFRRVQDKTPFIGWKHGDQKND